MTENDGPAESVDRDPTPAEWGPGSGVGEDDANPTTADALTARIEDSDIAAGHLDDPMPRGEWGPQADLVDG